jgi:hypothetical protein
MVDGLRGLSLPDNFEDGFVIHFNEAPIILSEAEKLANLKARKELGLDTMIDLVMKDNPSFSYEQAEEKLKQILEEKIKMAMDSEEESPAQEAKPEDKSEDESEGENEDDKSGSNSDQNSLDD